ncbi:MAG: hypothetical protein HY664_07795 [Chloroflexi bacterium]|nr:hypothetical protein [Chloroflexota bacterium]
MQMKIHNVGFISALTYVSISVVMAGAFFLATTLDGDYSNVARYGGTAWVFLLSLIITMPTVTPFWKKRLKD